EGAPVAGRAGFSLARARPHLAVIDYLPHLGTPQQWAGPRHKASADDAFSHALAALLPVLCRPTGVVICLPAYLDEMQAYAAHRLADAANVPVLGTVQVPLAALVSRVAGDPLGPLPGLALVVDCDGYALTWSVVDCSVGHCGARMVRPSPALGRAAWV